MRQASVLLALLLSAVTLERSSMQEGQTRPTAGATPPEGSQSVVDAEQADHAMEPPEITGMDGRRVVRRRVSRPAMIRPAECVVVGGLGRGRLQQIVQRSIRPRVRDCFAQARAGNPHWSGRAVLVLTIQGSELSAEVETESETLRQCILDGAEYLVPPEAAVGEEWHRTVVRYPFVSPAYRGFPAPALQPATSELLDSVFHEEASTPPLAMLDASLTP